MWPFNIRGIAGDSHSLCVYRFTPLYVSSKVHDNSPASRLFAPEKEYPSGLDKFVRCRFFCDDGHCSRNYPPEDRSMDVVVHMCPTLIIHLSPNAQNLFFPQAVGKIVKKDLIDGIHPGFWNKKNKFNQQLISWGVVSFHANGSIWAKETHLCHQ